MERDVHGQRFLLSSRDIEIYHRMTHRVPSPSLLLIRRIRLFSRRGVSGSSSNSAAISLSFLII